MSVHFKKKKIKNEKNSIHVSIDEIEHNHQQYFSFDIGILFVGGTRLGRLYFLFCPSFSHFGTWNCPCMALLFGVWLFTIYP